MFIGIPLALLAILVAILVLGAIANGLEALGKALVTLVGSLFRNALTIVAVVTGVLAVAVAFSFLAENFPRFLGAVIIALVIAFFVWPMYKAFMKGWNEK